MTSAEEERLRWKNTSKVEIYSNSRKKWFQGEIVAIFSDSEGEWLEIRYDGTMSKQVQRFSSDIRPIPKKEDEPSPDLPFTDKEIRTRSNWAKGSLVEIYSNSHAEWYVGQCVSVVKDDEGEWLTVVWERDNGEAMSKQVQRYSTDVRPASRGKDDESDTSSSDDEEGGTTSGSYQSTPSKTVPRFSRNIPSSTHSFPATGPFRKGRPQSQMHDITESKNEGADKILDRNPRLLRRRRSSTVMSTADVELIREDMVKFEHGSFKQIRNEKLKKLKFLSKSIDTWTVDEVEEFVKSFGSAYENYGTQFKSSRVTGMDLVQYTEESLAKQFRMCKLHRLRILLEIHRLNEKDKDQLKEADELEGFNWTEDEVRVWADKNEPPLKLYSQNFLDNGVNGLLLFELDFEDLKDMRIPEIAHQKILMTIRETQAQFLDEPPDYTGIEQASSSSSTSNITKAVGNSSNSHNLSNGNTQRNGHLAVPAGHLVNVVKDMVSVLRDVVKLSSTEAETRIESASDKCSRLSKTSGPQQQKILVQVVQEIAGVMRLVVGNKNKELKLKTDRIWQQAATLSSSNLSHPAGLMSPPGAHGEENVIKQVFKHTDSNDEELANMWELFSPAQQDDKKDDSGLDMLSSSSSNGTSKDYSIPKLEMLPTEKNIIKKASEGTRRRQSAHVLPTTEELNAADENSTSESNGTADKKSKKIIRRYLV